MAPASSPAVSRGRRPTRGARHAWRLVLLVALAARVGGQAPAQPEPADDPLGRRTPRGTVTSFVRTVGRGDFTTAERYLQLTPAQRLDADALARGLAELMDRHFTQSLVTISLQPSGTLNDGLAPDRERVGRLAFADMSVDIVLVRVNDPEAGQIWLFSSETLAQVPARVGSIDSTWIERLMPDRFVRTTLLGYSIAQWIVLAAALGVPFVLLLVGSHGAMAVARRTLRNPGRRASVESWYTAVRWPLVVALTVSLAMAVVPLLGIPLRFRFADLRVSLALLVVALAWLMRRVLTRAMAQALELMSGRNQTGRRSLALLAERAGKVVITLMAIFGILAIFGVDTRTALAGVGIGGVAVAFGAQRTVENFLGGIFLLSDKALAVGDTCCISNRVGVVEDISLRSVRLRTVEQSLLSVPAGALSQSGVENFSTREKILARSTLRLRYGTTTDQVGAVLDRIRTLLAENPRIETRTSHIRLVDFGVQAIELELFAYVLTSDWPTFLSVRENLLLQVGAIVESSGTGFAQPAPPPARKAPRRRPSEPGPVHYAGDHGMDCFGLIRLPDSSFGGSRP